MRTKEDVAKDLHTLYHSEFGGKQKGRFKISKEDFKKLAQRESLHSSFAIDVMVEAERAHGLKVIELADGRYFGVIEEAKVFAWRAVPSRLV